MYTPETCFLEIKLDEEAIQKLYLPVSEREGGEAQISAETVRRSIINSKLKLKIKEEDIITAGHTSLRITPPPPAVTAAKRESTVGR